MAAASRHGLGTEGQIYGEYLVILAVVSMVVLLAVVGLGGPLLEFFRMAEGVLLLPV